MVDTYQIKNYRVGVGIVILAFILWVAGCCYIFDRSNDDIEQQFVNLLMTKELEVTQLLDITFAYNTAIKQQLESELSRSQDSNPHPLSARIKDYPQFNAYGLSGDEELDGEVYSANLTGVGSYFEVDERVRKEINASFFVDLSAPFSQEKYNFVWSYYQSKEGFVLLSPAVSINNFQFDSEQYKKSFWKMSIPENNPGRDVRITDLYVDAAGQGEMITIVSPVYVGDDFKGVAALDLGIEYLQTVLDAGVNSITDNVFLINKNGGFAFNAPEKTLLDLSDIIGQDTPSYQFSEHSGKYWMVSDLIKSKFYVSVALEQKDLVILALKKSAASLLVLTLFFANSYLIYALYNAFSTSKKLAQKDLLSGLFNRITHEELSNQLFRSATELAKPISILMVDIDNFKNINDTRGHHAGDVGIKQVASMLQSSSGKADIVGRFGGEEFVITMPDKNEQQAYEVAEKIRQSIESDCALEGERMTVSIGLAESQVLQIDSYHELCKKADEALYQAKHKGRNCTVRYH